MNEILKPRFIIALMFYSAYCYMIILSREVPDSLINIVSTLMGFYFGSKVGGQK